MPKCMTSQCLNSSDRSTSSPSLGPYPPIGSYTDTQQVALKERGIDKLLEEAREDNKENDAIHMKRK